MCRKELKSPAWPWREETIPTHQSAVRPTLHACVHAFTHLVGPGHHQGARITAGFCKFRQTLDTLPGLQDLYNLMRETTDERGDTESIVRPAFMTSWEPRTLWRPHPNCHHAGRRASTWANLHNAHVLAVHSPVSDYAAVCEDQWRLCVDLMGTRWLHRWKWWRQRPRFIDNYCTSDPLGVSLHRIFSKDPHILPILQIRKRRLRKWQFHTTQLGSAWAGPWCWVGPLQGCWTQAPDAGTTLSIMRRDHEQTGSCLKTCP